MNVLMQMFIYQVKFQQRIPPREKENHLFSSCEMLQWITKNDSLVMALFVTNKGQPSAEANVQTQVSRDIVHKSFLLQGDDIFYHWVRFWAFQTIWISQNHVALGQMPIVEFHFLKSTLRRSLYDSLQFIKIPPRDVSISFWALKFCLLLFFTGFYLPLKFSTSNIMYCQNKNTNFLM